MPSEQSIEDRVVAFAKKKGWKVYKFKAPGNRGVADRIFLKSGRTFFIEFKKPRGVTAKLQRVFQRDMLAEGFGSYRVSDVNEGCELVNYETEALNQKR